MTPQTKGFVDQLLRDLRKSPEVQAHQAIQAVILGAIKIGLPTHECREVLDILRMEYGADRESWAKLIVQMIRGMPEEFRGDTRIIIP